MGINKVIAGTGWTSVDTSGSLPPILNNLSGEIVLLRLGGTGDDLPILPGKAAHLKGNSKIVHIKSASGTAVVAVVAGVVLDGQNEGAYDADLGANLHWQLNPDRSYLLPQQESDSGQTDGTEEWFIDFLGYDTLSISIQDTPGVAGLNTYKIYASPEAGNLDDDSANYDDVGSLLFGAASWTTDALIINSIPFRAHYVKLERVRTGDAANNDGGSLIDIQGG
jgi:hypothetical protein